MVRQRVRIRFSKQGDLRLIGHRDLMRCLQRLFRRAGLPLGMSQGFHPKPRMSFPLALAVGIEGIDEVMELELAKVHTAEEVQGRLQQHAVPGLTFRKVEILPEGSKKARVQAASYRMPIPSQFRRDLQNRIDRLMARTSCPIQRPKRRTPIDLRELLDELTLQEGVLAMRLRTGGSGSASPRDVLAELGLTELELADTEHQGIHLTRVAVEIQS